MKNVQHQKFESRVVMKRDRETDMRRITYPLFINSLAREETRTAAEIHTPI